MDPRRLRRVVNLFKCHRGLWDLEHPLYHDNNERRELWREISLKSKVPVGKLKKKINSLLSTYRRERAKEQKSKRDKGKVYKSKWYAYNWFHFLPDKKTASVAEITNKDEEIEETAACELDVKTCDCLKDDLSIFGEFVANKIRRMSDHTVVSIVQQKIRTYLEEIAIIENHVSEHKQWESCAFSSSEEILHQNENRRSPNLPEQNRNTNGNDAGNNNDDSHNNNKVLDATTESPNNENNFEINNEQLDNDNAALSNDDIMRCINNVFFIAGLQSAVT